MDLPRRHTMIRTGLTDVPLNDYALDILKVAEWFISDENYKSVQLGCRNKLTEHDKQYYTGEQYRDKIIGMGENHDGFPEIICAHSFGLTGLKFSNNEDLESVAEEVNDRLQTTIQNIAVNLCVRRNALFAIYPPGGYISWHNNANASAYNIIFTWSETGEGFFEYWDPVSKSSIVIPDVQGWQCKAGYFGSYDQDPKTWCYHTAGTDCLRMTIAFTLSKDEMALGIQDMIIEDISA